MCGNQKIKQLTPPPPLLSHKSLYDCVYFHYFIYNNSFKLMEFGLCGVNGRTAYLSSVGLEIKRALGHVTPLRRQVAVNTVRGIPERARNVIP